ncbi:MAG: zinc-ribbon domain-containing protein [Candidatus Methanomethylophilaceae archaeon]|nr:zinc-ribbon domain-containing protein [Candidatus Methanomethylophilaceae archaeon]
MKNEVLDPSLVKAYSNKKYWWICKEGHEWQATMNNRVKHKSGCPICYKQKEAVKYGSK